MSLGRVGIGRKWRRSSFDTNDRGRGSRNRAERESGRCVEYGYALVPVEVQRVSAPLDAVRFQSIECIGMDYFH